MLTLLPPLQYGIDPEEMYLIIRPPKQIHSLSKECTLAYIDAIYTTITQYQNKDTLYKTSQEMPEKLCFINTEQIIKRDHFLSILHISVLCMVGLNSILQPLSK